MKKILIIDEKEHHRDGTGMEFLNVADPEVSELVSLVTQVNEILIPSRNSEIELSFEVSEYEWIFLHDSYNDSTFDDGQLASLKGKIPKYVLFSGGKTPNYGLKSTSRSLLFSNLEKALKAYQLTGHFPVKMLFDRIYHRYYPLLDLLEDYLINQDIQTFLVSKELSLFLKLLNYSDEQIVNKIIPKYSHLTSQELYQKVEDWRRQSF